MRKALAKKWADALRSGKYKQGKRMLYNPTTDKYCCLAVLGVVCGLKPIAMDGGDVLDFQLGKDLDVKFKYELDHPEKGSQTLLAQWNDKRYGLSFEEIADLVEVCYEEI